MILAPLILLAGAPGVSRVVVYPDRAQVTRVATLACGARTAVRFDAIPPAADPATIRAQSTSATIEGLKTEAHAREDTYGPQVKALDEDIEKRTAAIAALQDQQARAEAQSRAANSYNEVAVAEVAHELSEPAPNVKGWGQALDVSLQAHLKAASAVTQLGAQLREKQRQLEDVQRKRATLGAAAARREYLAEVLASCPAGQQATVELTYLVGGASWEPAYEARADEGAGVVDLSTYATVRQSTGEAWAQARVVLSTAVPLQNATPPQLRPLKVWSEERSEQKKVIVRRDEYREHAEASGQTAAPGPAPARMAAASQGLSVQLTVPEPADVTGDGSPIRLFVSKQKLKARFANRTVPKLMPFVFRVADLVNSGAFPLLPGPVDAFRRTGLAGHYPLERVAQGAPFHLTFGIDDALRVKRTVVEEVQKDTGLFSTSKRFRYGYKLELANYGKRAEEVELSEHVPVSELSDVRVEIDAKTTGGYELKPEDGIVTWRHTLKPTEKRTYELAFHVDVPSGYE